MRTTGHSCAGISTDELGHDGDHDDDGGPGDCRCVAEFSKVNPQTGRSEEDGSEEPQREPLDLLECMFMLEPRSVQHHASYEGAQHGLDTKLLGHNPETEHRHQRHGQRT